MAEDDKLLERAKSGDSDAFAELMAPHLLRARAVAARTVGSEAAADDIVQNALVKAYGSLDRFDAERDLRPWFLTIVRNEARNHGRASRRRRGAEARLSAQPEPDVSPAAEDEALVALDRAELLAAVARLSPLDRAVIETRFLGDRSETETAAQLGVPVGTVKSRTSRALRRLRVALVAVAVLLVAVTIPPVRRAVAGWLGLRGVRIERQVPRSSVAPSVTGPLTTVSTIGPSSVPTGFGQATTLAQARALVSFSFAVPHDARLGEADLVTLDRSVGNGLVTLWWHPSPRVPLPASPTEPAWGLAFSALRGSVSDISFTKLLPPGSVVVPLTVNGDPGYWIEGTPHAVAITTNGEFSTVTNRLATNTLLWQHGDVTYRLEAHIDRELAVSIAGTLA